MTAMVYNALEDASHEITQEEYNQLIALIIALRAEISQLTARVTSLTTTLDSIESI